MTNLSLAAQAVLDAVGIGSLFDEEVTQRRHIIAAALRAVADQLTDASSAHTLYAIAGELNGIPYLSHQQIPIDS
jgi:predicted Zn-dependent peptidase